jgi:hypothetical protein
MDCIDLVPEVIHYTTSYQFSIGIELLEMAFSLVFLGFRGISIFVFTYQQ